MPSHTVYSCTRCLQKYSKKSELLQHKKQEHGRVTQGHARYETVEDDICPYCHTRFAGSASVKKHLHSSRACGPRHNKWQDELSSAAPSTQGSNSNSNSQNSDAFDKSEALGLSDDEVESATSSSREARPMDVDSPIHDYEGTEPSSSPKGMDLEEKVDTGGNVVYVGYHPKINAGQPIRDAVRGDLPESHRSYPDVGALSDPETFEVAQLLVESGVSGRF